MMRHWQGSGYGAWPKVFVSFHSENRDRARQTLALLRKLTRLFDLNELRDADIPYVRGQEPAHMLFLYVIQLPALFLSSCADERILATIMSCALFGTIRCMLPCHAKSEFSESVMELLGRSMSVDLAEQSEGKSLYFGKIFMGPEDKKPPPKYKTTFGDFAMVTMGVSSSTDMLSMLHVQVLLVPEFGHRGHGDQTGAERTVIQLRSGVDGEGQGFNTGKFTEVACVKAMSDPRYNEKIHKDALTEKSEYRLCLAHGSFAMFVLTLCMTMRQTVMISLGLFCTELARSVSRHLEAELQFALHLSGHHGHGASSVAETGCWTLSQLPYGSILKVDEELVTGDRRRPTTNFFCTEDMSLACPCSECRRREDVTLQLLQAGGQIIIVSDQHRTVETPNSVLLKDVFLADTTRTAPQLCPLSTTRMDGVRRSVTAALIQTQGSVLNVLSRFHVQLDETRLGPIVILYYGGQRIASVNITELLRLVFGANGAE
ncbi:hypothetical protein Q5P01_010542 [Channa striata]|uniref:Uncharacterized protein n=1 Tax=Channa striata TaxID=64152 RepID=A0AA88MXQ8_CHASR|nr:hypothetical protein Q5P01_010542 [Channa striata]